MLERMWKKMNPIALLVGMQIDIGYAERVLWTFLKKLGIKLLYDPAISLLSMCPKKITIQKGTCTLIFIVA